MLRNLAGDKLHVKGVFMAVVEHKYNQPSKMNTKCSKVEVFSFSFPRSPLKISPWTVNTDKSSRKPVSYKIIFYRLVESKLSSIV